MRVVRPSCWLVLVCVVALRCAAQDGPLAIPPQSGVESEKQNMYFLLEQLRAAIRSNDWAEAGRLSGKLDAAVSAQRRETKQASPGMELAHLELMAGHNPITRSPLLPRLAKAAYAAQMYEKAASYAKEALEAAKHGEFWWTGDAVHQGNIVLGRLALSNGDTEAAVRRLLAAGKAPESLNLAAFGPNMGLARDLLAKGKKEEVLQYLEDCVLLWKRDRGRLAEWLALIRAGLTPNFGAAVDN